VIKDLSISRMIPLVAASSALCVIGCGVDKRDVQSLGESVEDEVETLVDLQCNTLQQCDSAEFSREFDSLQDCVQEYQEYSDEFLVEARDVGISEECILASLEYYTCYYGKDYSCTETNDKCDAEYTAYENACEDEDLYQYYDDYDY